MTRFLFLIVVGLLLAPSAGAQYIDCNGPEGPCTATIYGLGNDPTDGPFEYSHNLNRQSRGDGSCGSEASGNYQGRMRIRELDNCVVTGTNRCMVEIPQIPIDSGYMSSNRADIPLGSLGVLAVSAGAFTSLDGNVGFRQLLGSCVNDAGGECGLDSDCPGGEAGDCQSTCFSDPGTQCASHADCPSADCITAIEWDGIGTCTDDATLCTSDADCSGEDVCEAGLETSPTDEHCICCHSTLGTLCPALVALPEYPIIACGEGLSGLIVESVKINTPDWVFEGGRETEWAMEYILVPGVQEGLCDGNPNRSCGPKGDLWAGAQNSKCQNSPATCQSDPFDPANPALPSVCDDVAFGGIAGDFCSLEENGLRESLGDILADGTQNPNSCPNSWSHMAGRPNELCAIPSALPLGDPQPGCRLLNYGVDVQWDLDCNDIADTIEGVCTPVGGVICSDPSLCPNCAVDADCASGNCVNNGDLCPALNEADSLEDSNQDNIGDECQCGDVTGDGAISSPDIGGTALCANGAVGCDPTIVDATGDNATTAEDIAGVVSVVNGAVATTSLSCVRNP